MLETAATRQTVVNGVTLNYCLDGMGARPLVLIHGVGSYLEAWNGVVEALATDFAMLRFDLRGHGRSERVKGRYEIDDFVNDLLALADKLDIETFDLAGFSLGGLIAQRVALAAGQRIRRLVLISTVAGRTAEEQKRVVDRLVALQRSDGGAHYDASLDRWLTPDFQRRNPDLLRQLRQRNAETDPACYASAYRVLAECDQGTAIRDIRCPTLIMTGEEDQGSNPRMAAFMHDQIAGSQLRILQGLRHSVLVEAPDLVAGHMRAFLLP